MKLTTLRNIGVAMERKLRHIGITTAEELLERDTFEVFHALELDAGEPLHPGYLYALYGAKHDIPWEEAVTVVKNLRSQA